MNIIQILSKAAELKASDVHIAVGNPPTLRVDGKLVALESKNLQPDDTLNFARFILSENQIQQLQQIGQVDIAYRLPDSHIFRVNVYRYSNQVGMACRIISENIPTIAELELPDTIERVARFQSGLVLVTGPTGCGKTTTIAAIVDQINKTKSCHILTIEDPIEYIHKSKSSIVTQREVGRDCQTFTDALRAGLRQDPDVIVVGEMRDIDTISTALTAAETGHLVLATLHTRNAYLTIERIIDVFPANQQQQVRVQLANSLMAVFAQRLVPRANNQGRVVAVESLIVTSAVRNLIRENKVHQLHTFIQTGQRSGMQTFDDNLKHLFFKNIIDKETLYEHATDREIMLKTML